MNKKQRAKLITAILDHHFPNPQVPLRYCDPFTLLVAVCLSAQCTDERVNAISPALFAIAPTPQAMSQVPYEELERLIRPCGLSKGKAQRLIRMSQQLMQDHEGQVPCSMRALEKLDGVGHKTASVVMSQAFGLPAFAIDTHILRCAVRWGLSKHTKVEGVEKDLKRLFPKSDWSKTHLQMILFARSFCPARGHHLQACPICSALMLSNH